MSVNALTKLSFLEAFIKANESQESNLYAASKCEVKDNLKKKPICKHENGTLTTSYRVSIGFNS